MFRKLAAVVAAALVLVSVMFFTGMATASEDMAASAMEYADLI